ncbi:gamma-glutamyl-gamma-aminobutyrate hydrolase family protein [Amycolatopsis granulosa]|uniref:gamma-glutamyl-gamma-aminobutyrate hydrolase family protein n=1 Tax=Amycolatopsis granulosa TaxID=185684 RepID=UPI001422378D|nr:putative glutamine amidotransferase [Amycolatopsis granulosa]
MITVGIVAAHRDWTVAVPRNYVDCVLAAGGVPVLLPVSLTGARLSAAVDHVGALLLAGGGDVDPARYGERPSATLDKVDPERDECEIQAFRLALEKGLRVLGVCRGAQLMAVATGGRLVQDLPSAGFGGHLDVHRDRTYAGLRHEVKAEPGTRAERVLAGLDEVNSHHHQAIAEPGELLEPTAWSADGVIEAVEAANLLGVQWHPETAAGVDGRHLRAFHWLTGGDRGVPDEL